MVNKLKMKATGLLIAVFISGVAVGGAASALADFNADGTREPTKRVGYVDRLQEELVLRQDQRSAVEDAMQQFRHDMHVLRIQVRPQSDSIGQITRAEIMAVLDESQRENYERINARIDSSRAERRAKQDSRYDKNH